MKKNSIVIFYLASASPFTLSNHKTFNVSSIVPPKGLFRILKYGIKLNVVFNDNIKKLEKLGKKNILTFPLSSPWTPPERIRFLRNNVIQSISPEATQGFVQDVLNIRTGYL